MDNELFLCYGVLTADTCWFTEWCENKGARFQWSDFGTGPKYLTRPTMHLGDTVFAHPVDPLWSSNLLWMLWVLRMLRLWVNCCATLLYGHIPPYERIAQPFPHKLWVLPQCQGRTLSVWVVNGGNSNRNTQAARHTNTQTDRQAATPSQVNCQPSPLSRATSATGPQWADCLDIWGRERGALAASSALPSRRRERCCQLLRGRRADSAISCSVCVVCKRHLLKCWKVTSWNEVHTMYGNKIVSMLLTYLHLKRSRHLPQGL